MLKQYDFQEQHAKGKEGENEVAEILRPWFHVRFVGKQEQLKGIDLVVTAKCCNYTKTIEVKSDARSETSGNVFVETVSNDATGSPGWAISCKADFLAHWMPGRKELRLAHTRRVNMYLLGWLTRYDKRTAQNNGYATHGICVPIKEFERTCPMIRRSCGTGIVQRNFDEWW